MGGDSTRMASFVKLEFPIPVKSHLLSMTKHTGKRSKVPGVFQRALTYQSFERDLVPYNRLPESSCVG